jgi:uncharacterized membrane protein
METKKITLTLFLFLLLIQIASAKEDFSASSSDNINLCPCSNQAYPVTIYNKGDTASSYSVVAGGSAAPAVTFNPNKFILKAGQRSNFYVFVNSECNVIGQYDLEVYITTSGGLTRLVKQTLNFSQCYDYALEQGELVDEAKGSISFLQHNGSYSVCKDEQAIIPILIKNNEKADNKYELFLDSPDWAVLNAEEVTLTAEKAGVFLIDLDTKGAEEGTYNLKLSAISELGEVQRNQEIKVNVEECDSIGIDLGKEKYMICGGENSFYNISVTNLGTLPQNVELELQSPEWANLSEKSFYLAAGSGKNAVISAMPENDVSGTFLVSVLARINNKTVSASDNAKIEVTPRVKCYHAAMNMKTSLTNYYAEDFVSIKVKNDGTKKASYKISVDGVQWAAITPLTIDLNPGQTGNLNLKLSPPADFEPGTYAVNVNLETGGAVYSKAVYVTLKKESELFKKLKYILKQYRYYFYLALVIILLLIVFRKQIYNIGKGIKKSYDKSKVRRARLAALKIAREKRMEEIRKKKEQEGKEEKPIKKAVEPKRDMKWAALLIFAAIVALGIYLADYYKLFDISKIFENIKNVSGAYMPYIITGVAAVIILFVLVSLTNIFRNRSEKVKAKKSVKAADKKERNEKRSRPYFVIAVIAVIAAIAYAVISLEPLKFIKDFFVLYIYYFLGGIIVLVIIMFLINFYKPLVKYLKE